MILKKPNSRIFTVNLFADFILSKIPHNEESIISIVDCKNFMVLRGKTSYREILDIPSLSTEFNQKYDSTYSISHTIDLISYDVKLPKVNNLKFTLHKSENCSYHKNQIEKYLNGKNSYGFEYYPIEIFDDTLIVTSEFPHGHSLGQGRLIYQYGKHMFYSIPVNYPISSLYFDISTEKNNDGDNIIEVYNPIKETEENIIKSAILDVFDFDMSWINSEMKKVDWSLEITNPLLEYSFIKKVNEDFIIF